MTILYRPVLIESAEQAEALPLNTLAVSDDGTDPAIRKEDGWHGIFGDPPYSHAEMVSDLALVPIEAEEESGERAIAEGEFVGVARLVTPWEEA